MQETGRPSTDHLARGNGAHLECVRWVAGYLDDASLAQAACAAIVELAHHRELRHPHMDEFGPILDKIANVSKDATIVERAKRYRLGL